MDHEALFDRALEKSRVVTLCSYLLGNIGPSEMLDVVRRHACTLDQPDGGWQILTARQGPVLTHAVADRPDSSAT
jgi:hypothetical protein